jgi:hypothetical protein
MNEENKYVLTIFRLCLSLLMHFTRVVLRARGDDAARWH